METSKPQLGLGEYLRSEREKRHITIEQVASATKINIKLLHALEADNYDALPAKPFVRGFVTSYTRYVGLDHREVLTRFEIYLDEKSGLKFKRPADAPHIFVERDGQRDNSKTMLTIVMVGFLVVAVVAVAIFKPALRKGRDRGPKPHMANEDIYTVPPPPGENSPINAQALGKRPGAAVEPNVADGGEKVEPPAPIPSPVVTFGPAPAPPDYVAPAPVTTAVAPAPIPTSPPKPVVAPKPVQEATDEKTERTAAPAKSVKIPPIPNSEVKYRLIVRAADDAWVKYQVDDRPLQQYTLKKEKVIFVRARSSLRFTTAKPSAIEISYDNKEFKPFGSGAKTIVIPKEAEAQFKANPFIAPNPAYLSTPEQ